MTHIDTFSGIGAFALAARWAGIETVQFVEIDPFCQKVLAKNFPETPIHGDMRTFNGKPFRGGCDILTGGFPCQDISIAGKGAGITGARSGLWKELCRVTDEVRPRFLVVENVAELLRRGMGAVLGDLSEIGYDAEWDVIQSAAVGAPHKRERVFIVAYHRSQRIQGRVLKAVQRFQAFSWCENVRRVEDLRNRPDVPGPLFRGGRDGVPHWMDRLKSCGNAVTPQIAYSIFQAIAQRR